MGFSDVVQYWSKVFASLTGMTGLFVGAAALGIFAFVLTLEAARRREMSMHLHALSEAMDEQSRLMERMRRSLADILEVLASLESESRYRVQNAPVSQEGTTAVSNPESASALRQELELLKAEISAELPAGPTLD